MQMGALVIAMSDSDGSIDDSEGVQLEVIRQIKLQERGRISDYPRRAGRGEYREGAAGIWQHRCDLALPCATQNELDLDSAMALVKGGVKAVAGMINLLGNNTECVVLENIRAHDPDLAQKIMDKMFVFDDVMKLDDKSIQTVLKEVASETLVVALKGAAPELREKFLSNMSSGAVEALREDLESRGPMRLSEVEAQQKEILKTVRRLSDEGQIVLGGAGDEAFV